MGRIINAVGGVTKGIVSGTKKLMTPPKKSNDARPRTFLDDTPEEHAKKIIERRSRGY